MKKVVIISNYAHSLVAFRSHLIDDLIGKGCQVYTLAPDYTDKYRNHLEDIGASTIDVYMDRTGYNPYRDLRSLMSLLTILKSIRPDITFSYGIKPVVYGLSASYLLGIENRYAMIAGLGTLYIDKENKSMKDSVARVVADSLYRFTLPLADKIFFQNPDDIELFEDKGLVKEGNSILLNGSGVDLDYYESDTITKKPITFTLVARLIKEKGIYEFINAARIIKKKFPARKIRFFLVGDVDSNPNSVERSEIESWLDEGIIEWPGFVDNVKEWLEKTSVFVLPTYYREGTPRSILEAMSMSLPVITTDMPGSKETVEDGRNGFLVQPKNVNQLVGAMEKFINAPSLISKFGLNSRKKAEADYDVKDVNKAIIKEMNM